MAEGRKKAVLVVDDQLNWRTLLSELLEEEYEVTSVGVYAEALDALRRQDPPFHVAIVDIRLDDSDSANEEGMRLIAKLNEKGEYTNAIVVTGYPTIRTAKRAIQQLNAVEYVEKYPEDGGALDYVWFRKIVRKAADDAEAKRPRPFVRKGNHILVIEEDSSWRERLAALLREDEYEVDDLTTTEDLAQKLKTQTYNLLVLNSAFLAQDRGLLARIYECEPDMKIIIVTDVEIGTTIQVIRDRGVLDVVTIKSGHFNAQEFKETVRRSFAFEATKYIRAQFEGLGEHGKLKLGQPFTLVLNLQDVQEEASMSIWLPPKAEKIAKSVLRVSVIAPGMKIPTGEEIYWEIPSREAPSPLEVEMIPRVSGKRMIAIDIEHGQVWLGRLEKEVEVDAGAA